MQKKWPIRTTAWGPLVVENLHKATGQDVEELEKIWAAFQLLLAYDKGKYQGLYDDWESGKLKILFEQIDVNGNGKVDFDDIAFYWEFPICETTDYRYPGRIYLNPILMNEPDWVVAGILAHELRHHVDRLAGNLHFPETDWERALADWEMVQFFEWALDQGIASKQYVSLAASIIIERYNIANNIGGYGYGLRALYKYWLLYPG